MKNPLLKKMIKNLGMVQSPGDPYTYIPSKRRKREFVKSVRFPRKGFSYMARMIINDDVGTGFSRYLFSVEQSDERARAYLAGGRPGMGTIC